MAELSTSTIRVAIRQYLMSQLFVGEDPANLKDDQNLQTSGILDSLATAKLVSFLEREFDVELEGSDLAKINFERIDSMVALVERLRGISR